MRNVMRLWSMACMVGLALAPLAANAQDRANDAEQAPIQARPGGPESAPRTNQEVPVAKGARLVLTNHAGEVVVSSWDRDVVKVEASHSDREVVDVQSADQTVRIRSRAKGPAGLIDYRLTVPRWMPVNLTGSYLEAAIEGTSAEVTVETVHGNVRVVGGSGAVSVRSVMGTISVDKASGRVQATTVNEGIRLTNVTGDMTAETTNGDVVIENAQVASLEASTVNGDITFNGTVRDGGAYRLTTHSGDIRAGLGGAANATVFVRTFQGDFSSDFPIQLPDGQGDGGSKRFNFTLGTGSARIEVQSFNGDIQLARGTVQSKADAREQRRRQRTPGVAPTAPTPPVPPAPRANPAPKPPPPPDAFDQARAEAFEARWETRAAEALAELDIEALIESVLPALPIAPTPAGTPPLPRIQ
jgi:DUF4097 and DUF4098 domain-containing protein YvlB